MLTPIKLKKSAWVSRQRVWALPMQKRARGGVFGMFRGNYIRPKREEEQSLSKKGEDMMMTGERMKNSLYVA